ncbi:uncharacterized protein ACIQIH_006949 [Cyanocitta cristata]
MTPGTAHLLPQSPVRARRDPACAAGLCSRVTAKAPTSPGFGVSRAPLVFLFCQISTHTHGPRRRLPAPAARPAEEQPPPPPRFPAGAGEQWTRPSREVFTDGDGTSRDLDTPAGVSDTRPAAPRAAARPAQGSALHSLTSPTTWWRGGGRRRGPRLLAANHPGSRTATQGKTPICATKEEEGGEWRGCKLFPPPPPPPVPPGPSQRPAAAAPPPPPPAPPAPAAPGGSRRRGVSHARSPPPPPPRFLVRGAAGGREGGRAAGEEECLPVPFPRRSVSPGPGGGGGGTPLPSPLRPPRLAPGRAAGSGAPLNGIAGGGCAPPPGLRLPSSCPRRCQAGGAGPRCPPACPWVPGYGQGAGASAPHSPGCGGANPPRFQTLTEKSVPTAMLVLN